MSDTDTTSEPDYLAQTFDCVSGHEARAWLEQHVTEAREKGCTHMRATEDSELGGVLLEAWLVRPEHEGPPRWQMTAQVEGNGG